MNDAAHSPPSRTARSLRPAPGQRRSLEGLTAFLMMVLALPAGLVVTVAFYVRENVQRTQTGELTIADGLGFGTTVILAALAAALGWHARTRIRRWPALLHGLTTSTVALYGGLALLTACVVVLTRLLLL